MHACLFTFFIYEIFTITNLCLKIFTMSQINNILANYDCIGFDLDNTLLEYNVIEMAKLVYDILTKFLTEKKKYSNRHLLKPFESSLDFLQRGLAMDFKRGNIVKMDAIGKVIKACHGTTPIGSEDLVSAYGKELIWEDGATYAKDVFAYWNGILGDRIRCVLDYFDVICVLIYGRLVDTLDECKNQNYLKAWSDILEGLYYMYDKDAFINDTGEYFPALKKSPATYLKKCSEETIDWLKKLKKSGKILFLLTGSAFDFASFSAGYALGENWKDLFDVIVCFARKPGFFNGDRQFLSLNGLVEGDPCEFTDNTKVVAQGNWKTLKGVLAKRSEKAEPRIIYIGDNAVQDVLAPVYYQCCDTAAICEELDSIIPITGPSNFWGSYFKGEDGGETLWSSITQANAKICVPSIRFLINE